MEHAREEYRLSGMPAGCWGSGADAADHRTGQSARPLRLPEDHGVVAESGLVGRQGSSAVHLKVPQKQRPRGRLWLNDGSCVRLQPERANHVWSYDFVSAMTLCARGFLRAAPHLLDETTGKRLRQTQYCLICAALYIV